VPPPTDSAADTVTHPVPATAEEAVMVTLARLGRKMRQRLPGEDLDFAAIVLMKALLDNGPLRLSALASALDVDASTVSRHVRHLEDRGLLERATDPDDGRASQVRLTGEGRSRLAAGAERRRALVASLIAAWPDTDRDRLRDLLTRLLDNLDHAPETS
jgi:DNA-binding MarR family transcriptional regulator